MRIDNNRGGGFITICLVMLFIHLLLITCMSIKSDDKKDEIFDNSIYNMECVDIEENFERCSNKYTSCYKYSDTSNLNDILLMECGSKNEELSELKDLKMSCTYIQEDFKRCENSERACYIYSNSNGLDNKTLMDCL